MTSRTLLPTLLLTTALAAGCTGSATIDGQPVFIQSGYFVESPWDGRVWVTLSGVIDACDVQTDYSIWALSEEPDAAQRAAYFAEHLPSSYWQFNISAATDQLAEGAVLPGLPRDEGGAISVESLAEMNEYAWASATEQHQHLPEEAFTGELDAEDYEELVSYFVSDEGSLTVNQWDVGRRLSASFEGTLDEYRFGSTGDAEDRLETLGELSIGFEVERCDRLQSVYDQLAR